MSQSKKWKTTQARRDKTVRVKTARGRKSSSTRWLQRQLNDPYVQEARRKGYRSRAAFKLIEIDDRFQFLKPGQKIVDLGCAPGGWTQVAAERIEAEKNPDGHVIGIDLQEVEDIPGATLLVGDFMENDAPDRLKEVIGGSVDVVLSDMAAAASGHPQTDHLRITALVEAAAFFAQEVLKPNGWFVAKVLAGGTETALLQELKKSFLSVRHAKPPASRKDSSETYLIASGFRGKNDYS
ncbi:Ribosomal RNA large subunit methyltransferase E [Candidatus Terasakiella magnetica]|uniref:Ribosomal RNA large subunit methyltransferase E n=1 Tax=Candidatus Terasakiella magnetica TaxID=1867952 RepID=A0A1C3RI07_9PROT|nr:RlmE family RNA methyltransferase [Candidatus Terasakiella magnetica]SCA56910.1 Ribosomal RNA large subunit methyltransferase E [Candidatus Terasakiella magnetica]